MSARLGFRVALVVLIGAGYVLACHWLMTRAQPSPWNVVGVLAPMVIAIAIGAWRSGQRALGAIATLALAALGGQAMLGVQVPTQWLYLAQHVGVNLFLAIGFGSTLRASQSPLITTLARRVHPHHFPPAMVVYTRQVTWAWTLYFIGISTVSVALYALAPFEAWALFANLLTPLSVAMMFIGEYTLRYRLHPEFERTTVADAIRSYMHSEAR